jgi:hypothetical protein
LWQTGHAPSRRAVARQYEVVGNGAVRYRFAVAKEGALSSVNPENFVFAIQAFWRNSNWREIFAFNKEKADRAATR